MANTNANTIRLHETLIVRKHWTRVFRNYLFKSSGLHGNWFVVKLANPVKDITQNFIG
jgi:hypothetical protein